MTIEKYKEIRKDVEALRKNVNKLNTKEVAHINTLLKGFVMHKDMLKSGENTLESVG